MGIWAQAQVHATLALVEAKDAKPVFGVGDSIRTYSDTGTTLANGKPFVINEDGFAVMHGTELRYVPWHAVGYVAIVDHAIKPGELKQES